MCLLALCISSLEKVCSNSLFVAWEIEQRGKMFLLPILETYIVVGEN